MSQKTSGLSKVNLDPAKAKAACRKLAAQNRNHLAASETDAAALLATHAERLIDRFGKGIYAAYFPIRSEISPLDLLARLAGLGCSTALPITPAEGDEGGDIKASWTRKKKAAKTTCNRRCIHPL